MQAFSLGSRAEDPNEYCRRRAADCDILVILMGHCWGSTPDGVRSFTEYEFDSVVPTKRLVFLAADDFPVPGNLIEPDESRRRQRAFRDRAKPSQITAAWLIAKGVTPIRVAF
jgi:Domain of unknown function (DUF4062)